MEQQLWIYSVYRHHNIHNLSPGNTSGRGTPEFTPSVQWSSCSLIFCFLCSVLFDFFFFFLLAIVLSIRLRFTLMTIPLVASNFSYSIQPSNFTREVYTSRRTDICDDCHRDYNNTLVLTSEWYNYCLGFHINVRENRSDNQDLTIRRHWQHL